MSGRGWRVETIGERSLRTAVAESQVPELIRLLVLNGVDIYAVEPSRESLEEFYMELTGRGGAGGEKGGADRCVSWGGSLPTNG